MVAAMQLSAVTSYLTANIAAIPLLWILPLAAYLLTLIVAFEYARFVPRPILTRLLAVMLAGLAYMLAKADVSLPAFVGIAFFLAEMFLACLYCHVEAYALRPRAARELTAFYLTFAAGGAIGSFLIGIASPLIFSSNYDVAISFFATALVALLVVWPENWSQRLLWSAGSVGLLYVLVLLHAAYRRDTMFAARNFYASLQGEADLRRASALGAHVEQRNDPARNADLRARASNHADDVLRRRLRRWAGAALLLRRSRAEHRHHRIGHRHDRSLRKTGGSHALL